MSRPPIAVPAAPRPGAVDGDEQSIVGPVYLSGAYRPNGLGARVVSAGTADALPPPRGWGRIEGDDRLVARASSTRQSLLVVLVLLVIVIVLVAVALLPRFGDESEDAAGAASPAATVVEPAVAPLAVTIVEPVPVRRGPSGPSPQATRAG